MNGPIDPFHSRRMIEVISPDTIISHPSAHYEIIFSHTHAAADEYIFIPVNGFSRFSRQRAYLRAGAIYRSDQLIVELGPVQFTHFIYSPGTFIGTHRRIQTYVCTLHNVTP